MTGATAYEVLGVSESCSFADIKASFRRLAKETHPDLASRASAESAGTDTERFLRIVAAYEILSDSKKRAHYDNYLFAQRRILRNHPETNSVWYMNSSSVTITSQTEVVEWLKCYRVVINDILMERKVAVGSGYFNELETELYSAIRAAYYGPLIESLDLLPDCFEAEERSAYETSEVLHLVSGRDLFGTVCLADKVPELPNINCGKITTLDSMVSGICQYVGQEGKGSGSRSSESAEIHETDIKKYDNFVTDVYKDLELHISGRLVATASRSPPKCKSGTLAVDSEDRINVFLNVDEDKMYAEETVPLDSVSPSVGPKILLGMITGLGTDEEGTCSIYDPSGTKTHVIMKHRTLLVKHMHWYQVYDKVSACECRCSRARLPPSKFWLFEPRCSMHDIGGWYVETFGRDKKGRTIPSRRQWDTFVEYPEKRLHPAIYLLALAYRTLDIEDAKRRKQTVKDFMEPKLHSVLRWCKKLL